MAGYTKIFTGMLDSTIWQMSKEARLLWITMLLKKDREQMVRAPIPGLAHAARLSIAETEEALQELTSPDKYSQSKEYEGRRILVKEGGWYVVNGAKYRDMLSAEERRAYKAAKAAEYREDKKAKTKKKGSGPGAGEIAYIKAVKDGNIDPVTGEMTAG